MAESQRSTETPSGSMSSVEDIRRIQLEPQHSRGGAKLVNNRYICELPPDKLFETTRPLVDEAIIRNRFNEVLIKGVLQCRGAKLYK